MRPWDTRSFASIAVRSLARPVQLKAGSGSRHGVTRRDFIVGAAAAGVVYSADGASGAELFVSATQRTFSVSYLGREWSLERGALGAAARVRHSTVQYGGRQGHDIEILDAVWPGTTVSCPLRIALRKDPGGAWTIGIRWESQNSFFEMPLGDWLMRVPSPARPLPRFKEIPLGAKGRLLFRHDPSWSLDSDWNWTLKTKLAELDGLQPGRPIGVDSAVITSIPGESVEVAEVARGIAPAFVTRLRLYADAKSELALLAWQGANGIGTELRVEAPFAFDVFSIVPRQRAVLRSDSEGVIQVACDNKVPPRLLLERLVVAGAIGEDKQDVGIAGFVARRAHSMDVGSGTVSLAGLHQHPFDLSLGKSRPDLKLTAQLYGVTLPLDGADLAELRFSPIPVEVSIGGDAGPADFGSVSPAPGKPPAPPRIVLRPTYGNRAAADLALPLDSCELRLLRSRDLLNVTFSFRHLSVAVLEGAARLVAHHTIADVEMGADPSLLIVNFPPQNIVEEAFEDYTAGAWDSAPLPDARRRDRPKPIAEARLSAPTRLVFDLKLKPQDRILPFTVRELTNWADRGLVVSQRAMPAETRLDKQLGAIGIQPWTTREQAFDAIVRSLVPPSDTETAIEVPYRLILSPTSRARWLTSEAPAMPSGTPASGTYPLWHARLDRKGPAPDVRAVWSRGLSENFQRTLRLGDGEDDNVNTAPWAPKDTSYVFQASMNPRHRREIMFLSSIYGLPALRRLICTDPTDLKTCTDDENGQVVPAPPGYAYIAEDRQSNEGVFIPRPMTNAAITLTSIGGVLQTEQRWEPPAYYEDPAHKDVRNWRPSVNLQRFLYRGIPARDIRVEIEDKGFLFPFGHRAALLQITERKFLDRDEVTPGRGKGPTAYLLQRRFIVVDRPEKTFPALNQPFDGRPFPARKITLVTRITPPLVDYLKPEGGKVLADEGGDFVEGSAFWPKRQMAAPPPGTDEYPDVVWEYRVDDSPATARSRLLFVKNDMAHSPSNVEGLVAAYNNGVATDIDVPRERALADRNTNRIPKFAEVGNDARLVSHGGARRTYAESTKPGDTTFETKSWLLAATGRKTGANVPGAARFTMDAYMEGADQPPFYPVLDRAFMRVQSLERFLGRPDTTVETRISQVFIEQAFAVNPSEAFLDVIAPVVSLDLNSNGTSSGGVAKPNSKVVALSRSRGLIGGTPTQRADTAPAKPNSPTSIVPSTNTPPWQQGKFDPASFFSDAKLLGLISLKDIIRAALFEAAPKLVETVETAVDENIAPKLREGAALLVKVLAPVLKEMDKQLADGAPTAAELYPGLSAKLVKLSQAAERLDKGLADLAPSGSLQKAIDLASEVYRAIQETLVEIEAVAANPIPALAGDIIRQMLEALEALKQLIAERGEAAIRKWIETQIRDRVVSLLDELCVSLHSSAEGKQLMKLLFGESALSDDICTDAKWLLDIEPQAVRQRLEAEVKGRLEDIGRDACVDLLKEQPVKEILLKLLPPDQVDKVCDDPGGLVGVLPRAAKRFADARLQALTDSLFYEVFGSNFVNILASTRKALEEIENAARQGHEQLTRAIFKLIYNVTQVALESGILADISQGVQAITGACDRVLRQVGSLANDTMASLGELQAVVAGLQSHLVTAEGEVSRLPDAQRADAERVLRSVRQGLNAFNNSVAVLEEQRKLLPTSASVCGNVASQLDPVARVFDLRRDAFKAAQDLLGRVGELVDVLSIEPPLKPADAVPGDAAKAARDAVGNVGLAVLDLIRKISAFPSFAGTERPQSVADLRNLLNDMKAQAGIVRSAAEEVETAVDTAVARANALALQFNNAVTSWKEAIDAGKRDPKVLRAFAEAAAAYAVEHDRRIAALVARGVALQKEALEKLEGFASKLVAQVFDAVAAIYLPAATAAQQLTGLLDSSNTSAAYLKKALKPSVIAVMHEDHAALAAEQAQIGSILTLARSATQSDRAQARASAKALLAQWRDPNKQPAVLRTARDFAQLGELLLRGRFDALLDIDGLRRQLEAAALSFVPTTARLSYDFRTDVENYKGLFEITEKRPGADLVLSTMVEVDFLKGTRTVRASGHLQPFSVKLIPQFEAIQIDFSEAKFESIDGSTPRFDIKVRKVKFLEKMKFVETLAAWLSGGGKSGLYYEINLAELTLEVGYRFPASVINLGYFQILNIGFSLAAVLPLAKREAEFRIAVSSRDAPFLIVAPPYGGGGFVALTANANEITAVEASFEFGAVMPINFGPLKGHGRVTAGIYFKTAAGSTILEGFVQAVGEGSIACFTICVRLEVSMRQVNGKATGTATFQFAFKVGFAEISYGVTASYGYQGGGGGAFLTELTRFAALEARPVGSDPMDAFAAALPNGTLPHQRRTRVREPRRDTEWQNYRKQYSYLAKDLA